MILSLNVDCIVLWLFWYKNFRLIVYCLIKNNDFLFYMLIYKICWERCWTNICIFFVFMYVGFIIYLICRFVGFGWFFFNLWMIKGMDELFDISLFFGLYSIIFFVVIWGNL